MLITNAKLVFVRSSFFVNEQTGEADPSSEIEDVPFILLRHPFPQIENATDFRDSVTDDDYQQRYQETIYVVNVAGLDQFLSEEHCKQLRDRESGINPRGVI